MANEYVTETALKESLTLTGTTYADDDLTLACTAASRAIDRLCGRRFYPDPDANQVRYYAPSHPTLVEIDDLIDLTSLETDPGATGQFTVTWTEGTDFDLEPYNAAADGFPWTQIRRRPFSSQLLFPFFPRSVKVTGKFGWAAVPPEIEMYAGILAARLVRRRREAPWGFVGVNMEGAAIRLASNDPDVKTLIGDYMKSGVLVG